ncbi:hypothetical protein [Streptomyces sp. NPDC004134]|uniref:hypothetical protein n=1 Tax=Streptomyces sp. NPDC004134 TaxID=3364691 RepID=UPI00369979B9
MPEEFTVFNPDDASFAHGRAALLAATIEPDRDEVVQTLDLESGGQTTLAEVKRDCRRSPASMRALRATRDVPAGVPAAAVRER